MAMIKEIITLLNLDDWMVGDEDIDIAKGKYSIPKSFGELRRIHKRRKSQWL